MSVLRIQPSTTFLVLMFPSLLSSFFLDTGLLLTRLLNGNRISRKLIEEVHGGLSERMSVMLHGPVRLWFWWWIAAFTARPFGKGFEHAGRFSGDE
jgi:hypothetical protein